MTKTKSTTETVKFSPTDDEKVREGQYFPVRTTYWDEARQHARDAEDNLFNAEIALDETKRKFLDGDPSVPAGDVREAELNLERERRQHEIAQEPIAWLARREEADARSIRRTGLPVAVQKRKARLDRVRELIAQAQNVDAAKRASAEKGLTERALEVIRLQYNNTVANLEQDATKGKITAAQAQASADEAAKIRDTEITKEQAALQAILDKRAQHVADLKTEQADLQAFLAQYGSAARSVVLERK